MSKENPFSLQNIVTNAMQRERQEQLKTSSQLTLGEIILKLEGIKNKKLPVIFDVEQYYPVGISSWRGSYHELALEYESDEEPMLLKDFEKMLKKMIGKTLMGYKGGDFLMGKTTPIWVANYGDVKGFRGEDYKDTAVIDVLEINVLDSENKVIIKTKAMEF